MYKTSSDNKQKASRWLKQDKESKEVHIHFIGGVTISRQVVCNSICFSEAMFSDDTMVVHSFLGF